MLKDTDVIGRTDVLFHEIELVIDCRDMLLGVVGVFVVFLHVLPTGRGVVFDIGVVIVDVIEEIVCGLAVDVNEGFLVVVDMSVVTVDVIGGIVCGLTVVIIFVFFVVVTSVVIVDVIGGVVVCGFAVVVNAVVVDVIGATV